MNRPLIPHQRQVARSAPIWQASGIPSVSVVRAGRQINEALHGWGVPELVAGAVRIDSGLVTNALSQGIRPVWHALRQVLFADGGSSVSIVVGDQGEGWGLRSSQATTAANRVSSRGLDIVAVLALAWGANRSYAGHLVWADLRSLAQGPPGSCKPRPWGLTEWHLPPSTPPS